MISCMKYIITDITFFLHFILIFHLNVALNTFNIVPCVKSVTLFAYKTHFQGLPGEPGPVGFSGGQGQEVRFTF